MIIFASNLNKLTTLEELNNLFSNYGSIVKSKLMLNQLTKRSRGCAYLDMPDNAMAQRAISELNNTMFMESVIEVKESSSGESTGVTWK